VEAPESPRCGDGGSGRPHFGDDLEADVVSELDETPGRGLVTVAVGVAEQQRRGRVRGLRTGDGVFDGADGIEVGQGYGAVERSLCHGQGSLVRVPSRTLGRSAHSRGGDARCEPRRIPPHDSVSAWRHALSSDGQDSHDGRTEAPTKLRVDSCLWPTEASDRDEEELSWQKNPWR